MFTHLPIPIDNRTPDGYRLIVAYAKGDTVVVPIETVENLSDEQHNCDWEGCGSMDHVVRFSISYKYDTENLQAENERLKKKLAKTVPLSVMECKKCSLFECVDKDTDSWQCGDPISWCNPETGEEVCWYQYRAIRRDIKPDTVPLSVVEDVLREEFKNAVCGDEAVKIMMEKIKEKEGE